MPSEDPEALKEAFIPISKERGKFG